MRKVFLALCCLVLTFGSFGQTYPEATKSGFPYRRKPLLSNVEIIAGPSMVYFSGDDIYKESGVLKIGFNSSISFVHEFNSRFQLRSMLGYERKGAKIIHYTMNPDSTPPEEWKLISDLTLNFLTVSLIGKYSLGENQRLFFGMGPHLGYLIGTKHISKLYIDGILLTQSGARPDPDSDYKRFDFGLAMLIGYRIYSKGKWNANVEIMLRKGMVEINQPMITPIKSNSLSILLSIHKKSTSP